MIRSAERGDIQALAELWARAFPGERTVAQRVAHLEMGGVYGGLETAWIAEDTGRVMGAYRAYALTQHMHGTGYRMMGLAAVAVDETARRRGMGRELCEHAVRTARDRGDVLSVLYPFRPAFYRALGWGMAGELHAYRFRPESLLPRGPLDVRRGGNGDTAGIAACYEAFARETNGLIRRTQRVWRHHLDANGLQAYLAGDDDIRGYGLARFGRGGSPDDRPLYIRELVAADHDAYRSLLGWVSAQRDAWRVAIYEAAPDEHFAHLLSEPRPPRYHGTRNLWAPVARVIRGPMLRVIDVPRAVEQRVRWGPSPPVRLGLALSDPIVPENEGPFELDWDGTRTVVRRAGRRPGIRTRTDVFAQIFAGELRVREALALGLAEADGDAGAMDALFRVDRCFRLLDEF
jgi:predicted acetyltransferase